MIKEYIKKNGKKAYMFQCYLGTDPTTGKRVKTTRRGFKSTREAKIAMARIQTEFEQNTLYRDKHMTFEDVYLLWLDTHKRTIKESTLNALKYAFKKYILPKFGQMNIGKIKVIYCQKVINEWSEQYASYKRFKSYANLVMKYAVNTEIIHSNPFEKIILPREKEKSDRQNYMSLSELETFMKCVESDNNEKYLALFRLLAFTGMRKGELYALTWKDIDFQKKTLSINKTVYEGVGGKKLVQTPKTKRSKRIIYLDDKTISILKRWKKTQSETIMKYGFEKKGKEQLLFSKVANNEYVNASYANDLLKEIITRHELNLDISVHGFRHTHATLLFESGASLKEVQDRLGQSDNRTTLDIYTHITKDGKERTTNNFTEYANF